MDFSGPDDKPARRRIRRYSVRVFLSASRGERRLRRFRTAVISAVSESEAVRLTMPGLEPPAGWSMDYVVSGEIDRGDLEEAEEFVAKLDGGRVWGWARPRAPVYEPELSKYPARTMIRRHDRGERGSGGGALTP